jgi:hypothetical protein
MAKENVKQLSNDVTVCAGDLVCVANAEARFMLTAGNREVDASGGKVFYDFAGGKVFVNSLGQIAEAPPGY